MNRTSALFCALSGPLFTVAFVIGFVPIAGLFPPPSPHESAAQIALFFREHTTAIRIGTAVCMFGVVPLTSWGAGLAALTAPGEGGTPVLAWIQLACVGMGVLTGVIDFTIWALAAFRPEQSSPSTLLLLDDLGWFLFLFAISPFCLWLVALGVAILLDRRARPPLPRWSAYLSFTCALAFVPAGLIFFKTGPLAWNGVLALYVPLGAYFAWELTMSVLFFGAIRRGGVIERPAVGAGRA